MHSAASFPPEVSSLSRTCLPGCNWCAMFRVFGSCAANGCLLLAIAGAAYGQSAAPQYPVKAVRIVVPVAAGGNVDIVARTLGQRFGESFGHQVIVDNRP